MCDCGAVIQEHLISKDKYALLTFFFVLHYFCMKTSVLSYQVMIKKEGKYYVAYVPTLGISDFGATVDLAKKHVEQAIRVHVEGLIKTGFEVPTPDTDEYYIGHAVIPSPKGIRFAI